MGRVLVDDDERAANRGEDVRAVELPQLGLGRRPGHGRLVRGVRRRGGDGAAVHAGVEPELRLVGGRLGHAARPGGFRGVAVDDRERRMEVGELFRARARDEAEHAVVVGEADLALGGMDVHVEPIGRDLEPEGGDREAAARDEVAVGLAHRLPRVGSGSSAG